MKNKERQEVIDALIDCFTDSENVYENRYDAIAKFSNKMNIKTGRKEPLVMQIKEWLNSEYVEPFKITQAEKCILENVQREFNWIYRINDKYNELMISVNKPNYYYHRELYAFGKYQDFRCFNHLFGFIEHENSPLEISDVLENCEVVSDEE